MSPMKSYWKRIVLAAGCLAALLLLAAFPWGPLFPLSPVKPGYDVHRLQRADLVVPKNRSPHPSYLEVDRLLQEAEEFHQLPGPKRITVVVCRNWDDFYRFMPHFRRWKGYGMALHQLNTIYLTPRIEEVGFDEEEAIRHELSHAVLNHNSSFQTALQMKRQKWVSEGLAVWFQGGNGFLNDAEFLERAGRLDRLQIIPSESDQPIARDALPFFYATWHRFLRHLVKSYGRERFQEFLLAYLNDPYSCQRHFARVYRCDLIDAAADFQKTVREGHL